MREEWWWALAAARAHAHRGASESERGEVEKGEVGWEGGGEGEGEVRGEGGGAARGAGICFGGRHQRWSRRTGQLYAGPHFPSSPLRPLVLYWAARRHLMELLPQASPRLTLPYLTSPRRARFHLWRWLDTSHRDGSLAVVITSSIFTI